MSSLRSAHRDTLVIILGGGQGERLYPLTRDRAKPAVPFGGIYRIIDFTLSNCLNSGLRRMYVLTQYKSISLDRHIRMTWNVLHEELGEFVVPIPPQQRLGERWYLGTADAIYQNIYTLELERPRRVLILAGDHIYKMNYHAMLRSHDENKADITVGGFIVPKSEATRLGVMGVDKDMRVHAFDEKLKNPPTIPGRPNECLGSMGIYVFNTDALVHLVSEDSKRDTSHDFGRDILPKVFKKKRVFAHMLQDESGGKPYWRDVGTLDAYWEANMDLLQSDPPFSLHDPDWPIRRYTGQFAPASLISTKNGSLLCDNSIVSHGCVLTDCKVHRSVLSSDVRIGAGTDVTDSIIMEGVRIGEGACIRRAIIDKYVEVPRGAKVGCDFEADKRRFTVTDSKIVVVPKGVPETEEYWRQS